VVVLGDEKYVFYPGSVAATTRLKGTGTGAMTVELVNSPSPGIATVATCRDVPVTPSLVAQVAASSSPAPLVLDTNGDGQPDGSRNADSVETIGTSAPPPSGNSHSFAETGYTVSGRFWDVWQGGRAYADSLYINGFPIGDKHDEISLNDGKIYKVQWFERARYEEHPENQAPYDVLLGLLGSQAALGRHDAPFQTFADPHNGLQWFAPSGHTLGDTTEGGQAIAAFWTQQGGLQQFGYPLSQPFMEVTTSTDPAFAGKSFLVQYFERQRIEWHPENKGTRYAILLGRLGAEQKDKGAAQPPRSGAPLFGPASGQLVHEQQAAKSANVQVRDFAAEVQFYNPYAAATHPWDVAMRFRVNQGVFYIIQVDSSKQWTLNLGFTPTSKRGSGIVANWNIAEGGSNTIRLVVTGNKGEFYANGQHIATFDLSEHQAAGDVEIITGISGGNYIPGAVTRYENFTVTSPP
jgi:hypothetical protein